MRLGNAESLSRFLPAVIVSLLIILTLSPQGAGAFFLPQDFELVVVQDSGRFDVFQSGQLEGLASSGDVAYDNDQISLNPLLAGLKPSASYDDAEELTARHQVEFWFFNSDQAVQALTSRYVYTITAQAKEGAVLGTGGDGALLRETFNLHGLGSYSSPVNGARRFYFTNATADEVREDYNLVSGDQSALGASWSKALAWTQEKLEEGPSNPSANFGSPWLATFDDDWDSASDDGIATNHVGLYAYKLDAANPSYDWYRVDLIAQGSTQSYKRSTEKGIIVYYGWYIDELSVAATVLDSGKLVDYMPYTTIKNTTKEFEIGGKISGDGPEISASYKKSYEVPDVTLYDKTNFSTKQARWIAQPVGLREGIFTWDEPSDVARTGYRFDPSFIVKVAKGEKLKLTLDAYTTLHKHYTFPLKEVKKKTAALSGISVVIDPAKLPR